jgi:hypothetical protein
MFAVFKIKWATEGITVLCGTTYGITTNALIKKMIYINRSFHSPLHELSMETDKSLIYKKKLLSEWQCY